MEKEKNRLFKNLRIRKHWHVITGRQKRSFEKLLWDSREGPLTPWELKKSRLKTGRLQNKGHFKSCFGTNAKGHFKTLELEKRYLKTGRLQKKAIKAKE